MRFTRALGVGARPPSRCTCVVAWRCCGTRAWTPTRTRSGSIRHLSYAAIAICVLITGVAGARALRWTPLVRLGEISYGIYLYHLLVLALLSRWGLIAWERYVHPYVLWTVFAFAGSAVLATLSWRLVERPLWQASRAIRSSGRST